MFELQCITIIKIIKQQSIQKTINKKKGVKNHR